MIQDVCDPREYPHLLSLPPWGSGLPPTTDKLQISPPAKVKVQILWGISHLYFPTVLLLVTIWS